MTIKLAVRQLLGARKYRSILDYGIVFALHTVTQKMFLQFREIIQATFQQFINSVNDAKFAHKYERLEFILYNEHRTIVHNKIYIKLPFPQMIQNESNVLIT